ncbi:hypothetical protein [Sulfurisphaera ohwakuensis]|uniref:Uncharacterized protein n=1 Tax=Sulfurisphaera ohwakuensis TaxID=69656 RepID=A0A650CKC6_SULOH|nr:hypothetical protein [Sulfurisphaera ohwakuensis]MBB5253738.1 hypothetical protein [Sulfurisphaera ohwakuensis]QGR18286.1 hypothetical protein D1869_14640 [Sulfurisphaera ohwakuensis]
MIKTKNKNEGIKLVSLLILIFLLCPQTLVSFPTLYNHSEPIFQNATIQQFFQNYMQLDLQFWLSHTNYGQVSEQSSYSGNVVFTQSGIPDGNKWVVRIFSQGNDCIARYSSHSNQLAFNLPNGKYIYAVSSCNPLYVTSNGVNVLNVQGNANVSIHFVPAPWAGGPNGYHPYEPIRGYQTVTLNLYPTDGPEGLSFGAMNSTIEFCVYLGFNEIYSKIKCYSNSFLTLSISAFLSHLSL